MDRALERRGLTADKSTLKVISTVEQRDDQKHFDGDLSPITTVSISLLLPADSPRLSGEDAAHTHALAEVESSLPPIVVNRRTMRVIDGMHRLRAAQLRGAEKIAVQFFDGTDELAFLLAVRANVAHGLPLSKADRVAAAARIIESQPQWSDRAIATATGLSPSTVNAARKRSTDAGQQLNTRLGRDGRVRPINGAHGRLRASEIIEAHPDVPLRELAKAAGISVGTARDVRERLIRGTDPLPPRQRAAWTRTAERGGGGPSAEDRSGVDEDDLGRGNIGRSEPPGRGNAGESGSDSTDAHLAAAARNLAKRSALPRAFSKRLRPTGRKSRGTQTINWPSMRRKIMKDPALKYAESGRAFLKWIDAHVIDEDWKAVVDAVPPHWSNEIADIAHFCAERWLDIAHALDWASSEHRRGLS